MAASGTQQQDEQPTQTRLVAAPGTQQQEEQSTQTRLVAAPGTQQQKEESTRAADLPALIVPPLSLRRPAWGWACQRDQPPYRHCQRLGAPQQLWSCPCASSCAQRLEEEGAETQRWRDCQCPLLRRPTRPPAASSHGTACRGTPDQEVTE